MGITQVPAHILEMVVTYVNHHKGIMPAIVEMPLRSKLMKEVCTDPFDAHFIDEVSTDMQNLYDLILVSHRLF